MKYGILIGMLLFLTACQHPTVYVYTEGLTVLQKQQLTEQLQQQTLPFQFTELPVPKEFSAATLLTSEDKILTPETEQLANIMQAMGYQPQLNYVSVANHHYSDGNIGFYLRGEQIEQGFDVPQQLRTTGCVEDRYNNLKVRFFDNLVEFTLLNGARAQLVWQRYENYLVINYRNISQSYTHSTPLVATPFGEKPSDTFRYTAHVESPQWLNCSLQVVYMD
ncbi:hypothetical protein H5162_12520 [Pseudoalteromonas sp. SR41-8]|uniref:hypothetical protein n=1 Tax=unclassified Pseudoalteromonas TaxID=194690 RepID=UPI001600265A|nr:MULTISPECIES: hypothetical protein [unclassified Pseudoalteromonas]MBB1303213.1 hypothetical protein [Pseudoalteromonas sp. SR44-8]MBB1310247.1 hypothetical protein [Pseudoalteromonas sp. SR41-8]MBB1399528.1 hypothetical protein [Pseudoalteromonas sp. SG44-8]